MAKTLGKTRPASTIADMLDDDLIQQATQNTIPEAFKPLETIPGVVAPVETPVHEASQEVPPASMPSSRSTSVPVQDVTAVKHSGGRTGEHSDIQKMYRLTPRAARTLLELSRCLGGNLGFEVSNSVIIRSILEVIRQAKPEIHQLVDEQIKPRRKPSTAIGSEHLRDALEAELAGVILDGIQQYAAKENK
ncbi:MAG: hypothetical protein AAGI37_20360 [Planctomycetota bacterium]